MKELSLSDLRVLIDELGKLIDKAETNARFALKKESGLRQQHLLEAEVYRRSFNLAKAELDNRIHQVIKE
jgi:hypothetical protein